MGKSSAQAPGDSTVRQTNLPEYADPYFRRMLQGAEDTLMPFQDDLSSPIYDDAGNITGFGQQSTYTPYQGERIAPSSMYGDIQGSRAMTRGIAQSGIAGMPEAMGAQREGMGAQREGMDVARRGVGYTEEGIGNLRRIGQYDTGEFSAFDPTRYTGFQESKFDPYSKFRQANYNEYGFQQPDMFTGQAVQDYMSPYMQNVVDVQKQQAQLDFDRSQAGRDAAAVQAGAFGGSRQAVGDYLAQEGLARQMGDIQATGQQQAFQQAATQFGADRAAQMAVEQQRAAELARVQAGRAGELGRVQTGEVGETARVQAARAAEQARVQQAIEQSRQFGAGQALAAEQAAIGAAGQMGTMGQGIGALGMNVGSLGRSLAGLGQQQRAADIQGAQLMETIGRDIRAEDQARLDMSYEDFARQRDYPMQQYERMAGILRGVPVTPNVEEQRMVAYNPIQQALGAGISGLGLYKGLTS